MPQNINDGFSVYVSTSLLVFPLTVKRKLTLEGAKTEKIDNRTKNKDEQSCTFGIKQFF